MRNLENLGLDPKFPFYIFRQSYCPDECMKRPHLHNYLELSLVIRGSMRYDLIGGEVFLRPGDTMILNNLEQHCVTAGKDGCEIYVLCFYPELVWSGTATIDLQYLETFFSRQNNFYNYLPREKDYSIAVSSLICDIFSEFIEQEEGYRLMIKAKLLCLLTLLYRKHPVKPAHTDKSFERFDALIQYLGEKYAERITLADSAALCGLSPQYFSTLFRETFGVSYSVYLCRLRVAKCMELLKTTSLPVAEIARQCGFRNLSHFHKTFRNIAGTTANKYRAE